MSSRIHEAIRAGAVAAITALGALSMGSVAIAQVDDGDPEARIQQLENQLRQLTGQNEELQYRNRQLEDRLKLLQGNPGAQVPGAQVSGAQAAPMAQPTYAGVPPAPSNPAYRQPVQQPGYYGQPVASAPAPIAQDPAIALPGRRRGDAFDPSQAPNAPGAPRPLGGGQLPIDPNAPVGAPGGRGPGEPLDLGSNGAPGQNPGDALATAPPSASPKDEFDLGLGYMQRRDYALAEQTMRNFAEKYPTSPLLGDSQYWLGESFFQRQLYRDSAEAFLAVTTKFDKSAKAPDALLRLGQSLAALKEKEAACAAFGEVARKYPRASAGVKQTVDREQKRVKC